MGENSMRRCPFVLFAICLFGCLRTEATEPDADIPVVDVANFASPDLSAIIEFSDAEPMISFETHDAFCQAPAILSPDDEQLAHPWNVSVDFLVLSRSDRVKFTLPTFADPVELVTHSGANLGMRLTLARNFAGPVDSLPQVEMRYMHAAGQEDFIQNAPAIVEYDHDVRASIQSLEASVGWLNFEAHSRTFYLGPRMIEMSDRMDFYNSTPFAMTGNRISAKNSLAGVQAGAKQSWQWRYFRIDGRASWGAYYNRVEREYLDFVSTVPVHWTNTYSRSSETELDFSYTPNDRFRITAGVYGLLLSNVAQSRHENSRDFNGKPLLYLGLSCGATYEF